MSATKERLVKKKWEDVRVGDRVTWRGEPTNFLIFGDAGVVTALREMPSLDHETIVMWRQAGTYYHSMGDTFPELLFIEEEQEVIEAVKPSPPEPDYGPLAWLLDDED